MKVELYIEPRDMDRAIARLNELSLEPDRATEDLVEITAVNLLHYTQGINELQRMGIRIHLGEVEGINEDTVYRHPVPVVENRTWYFIGSMDRTFRISNDGYSKYYTRMELDREGKLPKGEQVYGYEQALDHLKELRERPAYQYDQRLCIVIESITEIKIPV